MRIKEESSPNLDYMTTYNEDASRSPSPSSMQENPDGSIKAEPALPATVAHGTSRLQTDEYDPTAPRTCEWVVAQFPNVGLKPGEQQLCAQTFYNIGKVQKFTF